jgi:predicted DNA-binding mobile mystery protein A
MQDLGLRLGTIKQRIERIEKDELSKKVTLETMHKAAEAMNCQFVYFIVPNTSLEQTVSDQVQKVADEMGKMIEKTMQLENQGSSEKGRKQMVEMVRLKLLSGNYKKLWRKK